MENIIFNSILKNRKGHYVHALEVESTEDIDNCIAEIIAEYYDCGVDAIKQFFNTMHIYYIGDSAEIENEVNNYDIDYNIEYLYN